ncbi:unnamed protein product [Ranitomeya imitator]|uniref:Striatin N-terminal domain-containing protein n=1 Tax=Ranitomeya imitator TaxID=111125 RepID=A0ABN9LDF8_9NEOB|nr:unnamed protein product [Ranitomeya imitator]
MDEQAGPGVFFNNNNNSLLSAAGAGPAGAGKGFEAGAGDSVAGGAGGGGTGTAGRAQYSIPGILHFLQHEWARFEVERAQWEVERAELQTVQEESREAERSAGGQTAVGFSPPFEIIINSEDDDSTALPVRKFMATKQKEDFNDGIQSKHRVTKRSPALSNPMFTLVTSEDIAESVIEYGRKLNDVFPSFQLLEEYIGMEFITFPTTNGYFARKCNIGGLSTALQNAVDKPLMPTFSDQTDSKINGKHCEHKLKLDHNLSAYSQSEFDQKGATANGESAIVNAAIPNQSFEFFFTTYIKNNLDVFGVYELVMIWRIIIAGPGSAAILDPGLEDAGREAQIAFLQGERKGQENLKKDLVRRIKMLEYALKQERSKYHKLKYGTELNQGDMKPPNYDSDETNETDVQPQPQNSQFIWKQSRQLLRQYLQEVGYTDTILEVKSKRVRALLGISADSSDRLTDTNQDSMVNGTETELPNPLVIGKPDMTDSASVLETFKFLENAAAEFSDEEDDDDNDGRDKTIIDAATNFQKPNCERRRVIPDPNEDRDTEEALKEFDFLVSDDTDGGESRSAGDGTEWEKEDQCPIPESWNIDQGVITKLKEQYKKERKGKKGVKTIW